MAGTLENLLQCVDQVEQERIRKVVLVCCTDHMNPMLNKFIYIQVI
jgi:hypothetical protein